MRVRDGLGGGTLTALRRDRQPGPEVAARLPQHLRGGGRRGLARQRADRADHGHPAPERRPPGADLVGRRSRSSSSPACAPRASSAPRSARAACAPAAARRSSCASSPGGPPPRVLRIPVRLPRDLFPGASGITVVPKSPDGFDSSQPDLSQDLGVAAGIGGRSAAVARVERFAQRADGHASVARDRGRATGERRPARRGAPARARTTTPRIPRPASRWRCPTSSTGAAPRSA